MHLLVEGAEVQFLRISLCVIMVWNCMRFLKKRNEQARPEDGRIYGRIGGVQESRRIGRR
jgi:hypothetical protein